MRITRYVLGVLAVVTALAFVYDMAGTRAIAGTPAPLSVEAMNEIVGSGCGQPPGYRRHVLRMLRGEVLEVGVTDGELIECTYRAQGDFERSRVKAGPPGDLHFDGRVGLVLLDDSVVELGRVAPEVAALEFRLDDGEIVKAELHGDVYLCEFPDHSRGLTMVGRAYDASGRLLREGTI